MQARAAAIAAAATVSLQAKKASLPGPTSVSITVDCTIGSTAGKVSDEGSSDSSADSTETTEVRTLFWIHR